MPHTVPMIRAGGLFILPGAGSVGAAIALQIGALVGASHAGPVDSAQSAAGGGWPHEDCSRRRDVRGWLAICLAGVVLSVAVGTTAQAAAAQTAARIGVVLMHGKGGSPAQHVGYLASALEQQGYLVANLEMPWSYRRSYDVTVADAVSEVEAALDKLRARGAVRLFVAGHSQGGLFALYFGGQRAVDGIIAIAPGGNAGSPNYREKLGESMTQARKLIADGKGADRARFLDFQGSKGTYAIVCAAAHYLSWFDPEGAMNEWTAVQSMNPRVPVLLIVPKDDYPALRKVKPRLFESLPRNPLTKLYEPDSSHRDAPANSVAEIERWITAVASGAGAARQAPPAGGQTPRAHRVGQYAPAALVGRLCAAAQLRP